MSSEPYDSRTDRLKALAAALRVAVPGPLHRVHHLVPVVLYGPVVLACVVVALSRESAPAVVGYALVGYALWTLTEYWLHRIVFHFEPEGGVGARLHFLIHGVHHDHPNDPKRLVMPPAASVPLALVFVLLLPLGLRPRRLVTAVTAGFLGRATSVLTTSMRVLPAPRSRRSPYGIAARRPAPGAERTSGAAGAPRTARAAAAVGATTYWRTGAVRDRRRPAAARASGRGGG